MSMARICRHIDASALTDILDCLRAGMFLLDEHCRIVHANAAGLAMIATGDIVRAIHGRIQAVNATSQRALGEMLMATGNGDATALPLSAATGEVYVAHMLPLTSGRRHAVAGSTPVATLLFIDAATLGCSPVPEIIARHYKLTPTELRVLLALVESGGGPAVAAVLGVTAHTVKSHLHSLFEKTGTRRQADLVKLVARFSTPLMRG